MTNPEQILNEIEKKLLKAGGTFDDEKGERKKFIYTNDRSLDLVACAGSGKTTCLLAKLLLLEKMLPFEGEQAICVLTHTNVAIDEIKDKIGNGSKLLSYPNFFGTIQNFVNKFLAIPAFKIRLRRLPRVIDSAVYRQKLRPFHLLKQGTKNRFFGLANHSNRSAEEIYQNTIFDFLNEKFTDGLGGKTIYADKTNAGYTELKNNFEEIFEEGILSYEVAFALANWYLLKFAFVKPLITQRFKYVFIDEMQDTNTHQLKIIEALFPFEKVIIQKIGDPNQAIYDNEDGKSAWIPREGYLSITGSLRFTEKISSIITKIRFDTTDELQSFVKDATDISPYIISFYDGQSKEVIPKFIEILRHHEHQLQIKLKDKIRIIGWNGKGGEDGGNNEAIQKYFEDFVKSSQARSRYFRNLKTYIQIASSNEINSTNLHVYRDWVLEICSRFLYEQGVLLNGLSPTPARLDKLLESQSAYKDQVFTHTIELKGGSNIEGKIKSFLKNDLLNYVGESKPLNQKAFDFLESKYHEEYSLSKHTNRQNYCGEYNGVPIIASTVHGVKGETHKATLYLETRFHEFDLEEVVGFLCGSKMKGGSRIEQRKKMVYVGLSRPSHLLCLAMRKNIVENFTIDRLKQIGFIVVNI